MQTFLPYRSFIRSVSILDTQRLGKQRVEAYQLIHCLCGTGSEGWSNHPAARMWDGYVDALCLYYNCTLVEWIERGYTNNMTFYNVEAPLKMPPWLGDEEFHASHRSNLLRKKPEWYGQLGWSEPDNMPYVWPAGGQS